MSKESFESIWKRRNYLQNLDISISEMLFNQPCVGWWWIDNYDGCPSVASQNENWREEHLKCPLYLLPEEEWYQDENKSLEEIINEHASNDSAPREEIEDFETRIWNDGRVLGHHRSNLCEIPNYSKDLNLIHICESKLLELGLSNKYIENLSIMANNYIPVVNGYFLKNNFDLAHSDAELKASAIIKTLRDKNEN